MTTPASLDRIPRPVLFAAVGLVNTAIDAAVFVVLVIVFGIAALPAHLASYTTGAVSSFVLNRAVTFRDRLRPATSADVIRFAAVNLVTLGVTSAVLVIAATVMPSIAAKGVAIAAGMGLSYFGYKRLVFA